MMIVVKCDYCREVIDTESDHPQVVYRFSSLYRVSPTQVSWENELHWKCVMPFLIKLGMMEADKRATAGERAN
jgi:hypothetical protein